MHREPATNASLTRAAVSLALRRGPSAFVAVLQQTSPSLSTCLAYSRLYLTHSAGTAVLHYGSTCCTQFALDAQARRARACVQPCALAPQRTLLIQCTTRSLSFRVVFCGRECRHRSMNPAACPPPFCGMRGQPANECMEARRRVQMHTAKRATTWQDDMGDHTATSASNRAGVGAAEASPHSTVGFAFFSAPCAP